MSDKPNKITMYGTTWCYESRRAKKILDENGIEYLFVDIDNDMDGRRYVEQVNNGFRSVPTIVFMDGSILVEPTVKEFKEKLGILVE